MSGEPQLERSVLEGKERDKLQAIAEALGLKPAARAKKADLIDGILRATGVEAPAAAEAAKPKRATRKRAAEAVAAPAGDDQGVLATMSPVDESGDGPVDADPTSELHVPPDRPVLADGEPARPGGRGEPAEPAGSGGSAEPAGSGGSAEPAGSGGSAEPAGPGGSAEPAGSAGRAEPAGSGGPGEPPGSGGGAEPGGSGGRSEAFASGRGAPSGARSNGEGQEQAGARNVGDRSGSSTLPKPQPQPTRAVHPPGPPGPGNHAAPVPGNPSQPVPAGQGQPGQPGQAAPAEGDVRRNRRRRGRDRDRLGAGYDQQAQQADQAYAGDPLPCDGLLELRPEGYGFLRTSGYLTGPDDVYVSTSQIRKFALRAGDRIVGASRPATTQERFGALLRIDAVGDQSPEHAQRRPRFEELTPILPSERLTLELPDPADPAATTGRLVDLLAPVGKGQRGLIVAPPRAGTTTVLKHIALAIEANHPDVHVMVLLVDARPEEVTDMRRSVKGEVIGSAFDRPAEEHTHVAELAIEVAKRRAELGGDVVVILDGLTRLARAYNLATLSQAPGGRITEGVDAGALYPPKKLFGAGRNLEEAGSLTILASALVETGSATDAVIFEDLAGTASSELRLDRRLAERRIYPAIDVIASCTAPEAPLLAEEELQQLWKLRRDLVALGHDSSGPKGYDALLDRLRSTTANAELLAGTI